MEITLEQGAAYDLRMAKVEVGTGTTDPRAHYVIGTGETATISLYEFQKNNGQGVNMDGRTVIVTLGFSDGSVKTITFTT